ncbi:unnamed protein product, partial [Sphenostylis stenocarpa]
QKRNSSRRGSNKHKQFRKLGGTTGLCYKLVFVAFIKLDARDVHSQVSYSFKLLEKIRYKTALLSCYRS